MKTLDKLNINSEKILKGNELVTLRGGYDVNYCGQGIDRWTCSYVDNTYGNSSWGSFCVPGASNGQAAKTYVQEHFSGITVNGDSCW